MVVVEVELLLPPTIYYYYDDDYYYYYYGLLPSSKLHETSFRQRPASRKSSVMISAVNRAINV